MSSDESGSGDSNSGPTPPATGRGVVAGRLNISNFIRSIADDVLRDVFGRGKYRDVILPMTVIRRLDSLLEPTKEAVLQMKTRARRGGSDQPGRRRCDRRTGRPFTTLRPSDSAI